MEHDDESYVGHLLRELEHKITRYATASEVFCCLSIEAFINFYGTVRLGETTYLRKFERLSITSKLTSLMVACESKTVPQNHPTMKIIKKTFRIRNRIVHPGTTEITHQKEPDVSTPIEVINEAEGVNLDTINFFKHFSDLDRNVDWKSVLWMNEVTWED